VLRAHGGQDRCTPESGSFFDTVPAGGDAYILKNIIHDWADDKALAILRNIREAIDPAGRLLLVEFVVPEGNGPHPAKLIDLEMLVIVGGRERTADEFRKFLALAGFRLDRVVQTVSPLCVLESTPV
jgi:C-methyltransferase